MEFKVSSPSMILSEKNLWLINALDKRNNKKIQNGTLAAVLIPIYERNRELYIVFTKRADIVNRHKGQISFPGGVCEDGDKDIEATALREAYEEVGIRPEDVRILGKMNDFESILGYVVTPVVGLISPGRHFTLNRAEVERIIEVPVANLSETEGDHGVEYLYETDRIWGLTARILKQLLGLRA